MHTNFGVPGLSGYLAICYFVLALGSAGVGGCPTPLFSGLMTEEDAEGGGAESRRISRTNGCFFKQRTLWPQGHSVRAAWLRIRSFVLG